MTLTISVAGRVMTGASALDDLLEAIQPLVADPEAPVVVDLSGLRFIQPAGVATLVAVCCGAGAIEAVIPPDDDDVCAYLERMDAFELIPCEAPIGRSPRREPVGFRECRRFGTLAECVETSRALVDAVDERCALSGASRLALTSCIAEMAENVAFHANAPAGGFAVAQSWPARQRIEVAIVDLGRGIRRSLAENPDLPDPASDVEALRAAFTLGVTATPERNSGQGLFTAARLLEGNGGRVLVRSGAAYAYEGDRPERGAARAFPGTLVAMTINTDRPLDAAAVAQLVGTLKGCDEDLDDLFD